VVESSGLLNRRTGLNLYRGFESPPLRHKFVGPPSCDSETRGLPLVILLTERSGFRHFPHSEERVSESLALVLEPAGIELNRSRRRISQFPWIARKIDQHDV
jgi:hypothetical protein